MNRILRRPMFRMGGSTSGITSGLDAPRKQFSEGSLDEKRKEVTDSALKMMFKKQFPDRSDEYVDKYVDDFTTGKLNTTSDEGYTSPLGLKFTEMDLSKLKSAGDTAVGGTSLDDAIALARAKSKEIAGDNTLTGRQELSRFLIPFGLNLATARPMGDGLSGLFATAAGAAKGPASQLFKSRDEREKTQAEKEADLFNTFLSAGLEDKRFEKKQAAEKLKESQELLTLYDKKKQENVIVKAADVYKNLENYGPSKADKNGRPFEKLEVANKITEIMGTIFELQSKKEKTVEDEQKLKESQTILDYLKGSKNTKPFADALLKDPTFIENLRLAIQDRLEETDEFKEMEKEGGVSKQEELIRQQKIDEAVNYYLETGKFLPELMLADGGRVAYQTGGDVMVAAETPKIDFDTLRARLPKEIGDDIVRLIASSPEALEDFATIQTQQDVNNFNMKYDVELILPAEA